MIGFYKMSMIGTAHTALPGGVCQDYSRVIKLRNGWIAAAIADGLGSAKFSDRGSKNAVKSALSFIEEKIIDKWDDEKLIKLLQLSFGMATEAVESLANSEGNALADYDTTLTILIYNGEKIVFGHVGDGGIIGLTDTGEFIRLTDAQKGEAFNETYPLRSGLPHWDFSAPKMKICAITMMTDGIFDMACPWLLSNCEQPIYINFIRRFMDRNILKANNQRDFSDIESQIKDYFASPATKAITDDKTIVGIINTKVMPVVKDDIYYDEPDWEKLHQEKTSGLYGKNIEDTPKDTPDDTSPIVIKQNNKKRHKNDKMKNKSRFNLRYLLVALIFFLLCETITIGVCKMLFTTDSEETTVSDGEQDVTISRYDKFEIYSNGYYDGYKEGYDDGIIIDSGRLLDNFKVDFDCVGDGEQSEEYLYGYIQGYFDGYIDKSSGEKDND